MKLNSWQQFAFAILAAVAVLLLCASAFLAIAFTDNAGASGRATQPAPSPTITPGVRLGVIPTVIPSVSPTPMPSATVGLSVTPTRSRIPPTPTPRPSPVPIPVLSGYSVLFQFSGAYYGDSPKLALPAGTIYVAVIYADDGEPVSVNPSDQYQHDLALRNIDVAYQPSLSIVQAQLNMALATHDAFKIDDARKRLEDMNRKKATDIAAENDRFDALLAALQAKRPASNIRIYVGRPETSTNMILTFLGSGAREVDFTASAASDYFFHVEATGGWTLNIYHKR